MTFDPWGTPGSAPIVGWAPPAATVVPGPSYRAGRLRSDLTFFGVITIVLVLLGAPAGLLWSKVAPHYTIIFVDKQATSPDIESTRAFIGADGSYLAVVFGLGLLCGAIAWWKARAGGPATVLALTVGGVLGALVAARVGVLPGAQHSFDLINRQSGRVNLFLGARGSGNSLHIRSPWAAVGWPVGALLGFLGPALVRPEELD